MLEEEAVVVSVGTRECVIELSGPASCSACNTPCSNRPAVAPRQLALPVPEHLQLQPGERVRVAVANQCALFAAAAFYLGSILALILGAGVFEGIARYLGRGVGGPYALVGALLAFASFLIAMRKWRWIESLVSTPVILGRLEH